MARIETTTHAALVPEPWLLAPDCEYLGCRLALEDGEEGYLWHLTHEDEGVLTELFVERGGSPHDFVREWLKGLHKDDPRLPVPGASITYLAIKCGPWPDDCPTEEDGIDWCLKRWQGRSPQYVNVWPYGDPVVGETQVIVFRYDEGT